MTRGIVFLGRPNSPPVPIGLFQQLIERPAQMAAASGRPKSAPRNTNTNTATTGNDLFEYTTKAGKELTLPRFDSVKPGVIRKIRKLSDVDQFFTVLEHLADEDSLAIIDDLDQPEFQDLQTKWFEHAGVDMGEL